MTVNMASAKVNMSHTSGKKYYLRYLEDPNHNIPILSQNSRGFQVPCIQKQISDLIGYINNDKTAIVVAVKKAGMAASTAKKYYARYLYDPNREISMPHNRSSNLNCTKQQVRDMIGYLVNDHMTLNDTSAKANMSRYNARRCYDTYLNDPKRRIPNIKPHTGKHYSQHQIKHAIRYIVNEKLSLRSTALKLKIGESTVRSHYLNYLRDSTIIKNE
jgi:AraC-like DNA-binding protein